MLLRLLVWTPFVTLFHTLCFMLDYLVFPRLWQQQVNRPVFIIGHARSGTTLMHRLMSADGDKFSYFLYWEMFFPSLLQKKLIRLLGRLDERCLRGRLKARLVRWDDETFGPYRHMHNMSLWTAEEDCFAMQAAFASQQWSLEIPMMDIVDFFHIDEMSKRRGRWLRHYRELVKRQLLLNGGDKIHLSKNPVMSGWVESLIATFPDARFVVMIRDPADCIPSCLKLVETNWRSKGWPKEACQESLDALTEISFEHFSHPWEVLSRHTEVDRLFMDYRLLTETPKKAVVNAYAALGLSMEDSYDCWLQDQSEREKAHHSKFEYSLGEFRISGEEIYARLEDFYIKYEWSAPGAEITE